jgi:hypothetical protein
MRNSAWKFAKHKSSQKQSNSTYSYGISLLTERGSRELSNLIDKYARTIRQGAKSENNIKSNFNAEYANIEARDRAEYNNFQRALKEVRAKAAAARKAEENARRANNQLKQMVAQLTKSIKKNQQKLRPSANALAGLAQLRNNLRIKLSREYKRASEAGNARAIGRVTRSIRGLTSPSRQRR